MDEFEVVVAPEMAQEEPSVESVSYWRESWDRFKEHRSALTALCILGVLIAFAILAPLFTSYTYFETHLPLKNLAPSSKFWFGTDELGRDLFTRIWWGARISLFVGITAALIDLAIGVFFGAFAAWKGGKADDLIMRLADVLYSIPYMLVVILLTVMIGSGLGTILIALTMTGWIPMARIVRGQILQLKSAEFVLAARALGASTTRILLRHLIPNAMGPIITTMTLTIPTAIFAEAFLSFLGLGVQAPIASWGTMASDGLSALTYYPWRLFFPAGFICLTMLCFNVIGDSLRDAFDPRISS